MDCCGISIWLRAGGKKERVLKYLETQHYIYIYKPSPYRTVNMRYLCYKNQSVNVA
jgi:hypothetical protein